MSNDHLKHPQHEQLRGIRPMYARHALLGPAPRHAIPDDGMPPNTAYHLIHDELIMDGSSRFNLATFCGTWMEPEAHKLMSETLDKNMIDKDEYPQTAELEMRCVHMLAKLWNSPDPHGTLGSSTIGSSEACMLGGLALKWAWRERRKQAGKSIDRPNLVTGTNTQVCWHKFARYWDIEERTVPLEGDQWVTDPERAAAACDENTIGVVSVLGSTFTGEYEDVQGLSNALDRLQERTGLNIPIHVDGASGAFVAPFLHPDLVWDFRLPRVKSINTSGHKYGLVYPGVGWIVWREAADLHPELIFHVDYLGGTMPTLAINFSRPASQVVAQYYNLIRLGKSGYRAVHQACQDVAVHLAKEIGNLGPFELLSDGKDLPVFAWALREPRHWSLYDLADRLRDRGWQVPAYKMPANRDDLIVQRVVVRNGFTYDLAGMLVRDIRRHLDWFASQPGLKPTLESAQFHH
ncbi:MAG TPA: glutamate decarboxylase [Bryobacteraceae bacterium]|nr:glutamate decarboxylase [Bryobacteraceae bacterium]